MPFLTEGELAERWRYSPNTLRKWRVEGRGPEYVKLTGGSVRYDLETIEAAEEAGRRRSTSGDAAGDGWDAS